MKKQPIEEAAEKYSEEVTKYPPIDNSEYYNEKDLKKAFLAGANHQEKLDIELVESAHQTSAETIALNNDLLNQIAKLKKV